MKLSITIALSKTVLDLKQAIAEKSDVPADRQRLIYSGMLLANCFPCHLTLTDDHPTPRSCPQRRRQPLHLQSPECPHRPHGQRRSQTECLILYTSTRPTTPIDADRTDLDRDTAQRAEGTRSARRTKHARPLRRRQPQRPQHGPSLPLLLPFHFPR